MAKRNNKGSISLRIGLLQYFDGTQIAVGLAPGISVGMKVTDAVDDRRFFKALAENLLRIDASIDFVVDVFHAGAVEEGIDVGNDFVRADGDLMGLCLKGHTKGCRENSKANVPMGEVEGCHDRLIW